MTEKEYEDIYDSVEGFLFTCTKRRVSLSNSLSSVEIANLPAWCRNEDQLFVKCKSCDLLMIFTEGPSNKLEGMWACPGCGRYVREVTPYRIVDNQNRKLEQQLYSE